LRLRKVTVELLTVKVSPQPGGTLFEGLADIESNMNITPIYIYPTHGPTC